MREQFTRSFYEVRPDDVQFPDQWFLDEPLSIDGTAIDAREFTEGRHYQGIPPDLLPIGKPGRELAFSFGAFDMPVLARELAQVVQRISRADVECFPVTIPGARHSYAILNCIAALDCLDEANSEFTRWTDVDDRPDRLGQYHMISKIRIDQQRAAGHHVIRIKDWPLALIVSDAVKTSIEGFPTLGVVFRPAS